jgi:hypothetical protein
MVILIIVDFKPVGSELGYSFRFKMMILNIG